jgi:pyruvate dehydrogenase E1 component alpha subunit/2-oxoisovalerate dehydrogenase E1 component alpha subunit
METIVTTKTKPKSKKTPAKKAAGAKSGSVVTTILPKANATPDSAAGYLRKRDLKDTAGLNKAQLSELYQFLFETRRLEEHLAALYRQNKVIGGVYRSLGQEGTAVGCGYGLKTGDFLQPLIRDMGSMLVHGASPIAMLRQYMAKETGPSGGRDLNQHFSNPDVGFLGPVSMLGAMIPVLAGCLIAARNRGETNKAGLAFIGDGGSSTGAFYEGVNFAAVQKLPLIVVIENNQFAYSTPTANQVPDGDILRRAIGFGCTVAHIDGNDVLAAYEATRDARARGIAGEGPTIIVSDTFRRRGHAEHDNQRYVSKDEIKDWETNNDPVDRYKAFLEDGKHVSQAEMATIDEKISAELNAARDQAVSESFPSPDTVQHGVFEDGTQPWPDVSTWFRGGPANRPADLGEGN